MYKIAIIDTMMGERVLDTLEPSFPYTFESASISELQDQSASWSYTIRLPRSQKNDEIFGSAGSPFVRSNKAYERHACNVYADGVQIIRKGVLFIERTTDREYEVQIVSGNSDLFERLDDINLAEWEEKTTIQLPLKTLTPTIDDNTSMYLYPAMMRVGTNTYITNNLLNGNIYYYATPIVSIGSYGKQNGLLRKVLDYVGYELQTDTPDAVMNKLYISLASRNKADESDTIWESAESTILQAGGTRTYISAEIQTSNGKYYMRVRAQVATTYTNSRGQSVPPQQAIKSFFRNTTEVGRQQSIVFIVENENGVEVGRRTFSDATEFTNGYLQFDIELQSIGWTRLTTRLEVSQYQWYIYDGYAQKYYGLAFLLLRQRLVLIANDQSIAVSGQSICIDANLPFETGLGMFKMLAQIFGWIVNVKDNVISAYTLGYVVGRKDNAPDWTDKVAESEESETAFTFGEYAQTNYIRMAKNEKSGFQDESILEIPNTTIARTKELINIETTSGSGNVVETWEYDADTGESTYDTSGAHLMVFDGLNLTHYRTADVLSNYMQLQGTLEAVIVKTLRMRLTTADIVEFDQYTPIYLRQYGAYFYVNKISNWEDGKLAEVELLKI